MKLLLFLIGTLVLVFIFMRRSALVEKGTFTLPFWRRNLQKFHPVAESAGAAHGHDTEITIQEMIPAAETIHPRHALKAKALMRRAEAFIEKGDSRNAEKTLIQAISLDPSLCDAYNALGLLYLKQQQFGKAEMVYHKLVVAKPEEASYFSNLGLALYHQGKLAEAKSSYEKALALDQGRAGRFFSLGKILQELNEFEQALQHFQKALLMEPQNIDYLLTLAQFYNDRGLKDESRKILAEVLTAVPQNEIAQAMMKELGA